MYKEEKTKEYEQKTHDGDTFYIDLYRLEYGSIIKNLNQ